MLYIYLGDVEEEEKKGRSLCVTFVTPILCVHDYTDEEEEGYYKKRMVAPQQEPPSLSLEAFSPYYANCTGDLCVLTVSTHTHKSYQYSQLLPQNIFFFFLPSRISELGACPRLSTSQIFSKDTRNGCLMENSNENKISPEVLGVCVCVYLLLIIK